jgi:hypothetical protein
MANEYSLVPREQYELAKSNIVNLWLEQIRPVWKARTLIGRVRQLIPVDLSSACQRLLNAAIHDLREKVITAGIDIAQQVAKENRLPPIERAEDVEEYSTARLLDLCYKMGILSRTEWRKLQRAYDIRRDLEHEDDQYQAGLEDCVYIFTTCIEVVLSRDPVQLLRVTDVKEVVEEPSPFVPGSQLLEDYRRAPQVRQEEIGRFLVSSALDSTKPDIVRRNCIELMCYIEPATPPQVKIVLAGDLGRRVGRVLDVPHAKVAVACGALPYLRQGLVQDFYQQLLRNLETVGYEWRSYGQHSELLETLEDVGGLENCPAALLRPLAKWCVLAYVGEPSYGHPRPVFYSNTAAPIIHRLFQNSSKRIFDMLRELANDREIRVAIGQSKPVAKRFELLLDMEPQTAGTDLMGESEIA